MRKKLYRMTAAILAAILVLVLAPGREVFANTQGPVIGGRIESQSRTGTVDGSYNLYFEWNRPLYTPINITENFTQTPTDGGAGRYRIDYSKGSSATFAPLVATWESTEETHEQEILNQRLDYGSMYVFRILPSHKETTIINRPDTIQTTTIDVYPTSGFEDMLFMTDIRVSATGSGNSLTVTWDNPMLDGQDFFTQWRIYYAPNRANSKNPQWKSVTVTTGSDGALKMGSTLTYVINSHDVSPGETYSVKVEPLYWDSPPVEIRGTDPNYQAPGQTYPVTKPFSRTFNGKNYSDLAFSTSDVLEYRTDNVIVRVPLSADDYDANSILLYWDGLQNVGNIKSVKILYNTTGDFPENLRDSINAPNVGIIEGAANCRDISSFLVPRPGVKTYYKLLIEPVTGALFDSEIAVYDPLSATFRPNKPVIRRFAHLSSGGLSLFAQWDVFIRMPLNQDEKNFTINSGPYAGMYPDRNVEYDIYVADDLDLLDKLPQTMRITPAPVPGTSLPVSDWVYSYGGITSYYTSANGAPVLVPQIDENKIYYIKIVPRQISSDPTKPGPEGKPAYSSHFVPSDKIETSPFMISKPPLRIKKDSNGIDVIDTTSITIQWDTQYFEVYDKDTNQWYTKVGVENGKLIFGDAVKLESKQAVLTVGEGFAEAVQKGHEGTDIARNILADKLGLSALASPLDTIPIRYIDLSNALFALQVVPYSTLNDYTGIDDYINSLKSTGINSFWPGGAITAGSTNIVREYTITGLSPTTSYLILMWPYIEYNGKELRAMAPANIIGTTLTDRGGIEITPTVPLLYADGEKDMSLSVKWPYNPELSYELYFAELMSVFPNGVMISNEEINQKGSVYAEINENGIEELYMHYTIENLFPNSIYYIWMRAYAMNPSGRADSDWSSILTMKTLDIDPPDAPFNLGLVGENNLDIINKQLLLDYKQKDYNYIIFEWMRIEEDKRNSTVTPPAAASDGNEVLIIPENMDTYIVKFNGLEPNTLYYARAKTRKTVTKVGIGAVVEYQYIIQLSKDDEFNEPIEVIVPQTLTAGAGRGTMFIEKESDWIKQIIWIHTSPWDGEYDGIFDPNTYPLPDEDFELVYDPHTGTLTFRFRTDSADAAGNRDNQVDQRFISKLITSQTFNYTIDLSRHGSVTPKKRVVEIPYSIASAMSDRYISLTLVCGDTTYRFPAQYLAMPEVYAMTGYGYGAFVRLTVEDNPADIPKIDTNAESYAASPSKLSIKVTAGINTLNLGKVILPITVEQKITNKSLIENRNVSAYRYLYNSNRWLPSESELDYSESIISQITAEIGVYSALSRIEPVPLIPDPQTSAAVSRINSRMAIDDIYNYDSYADVSSSQFNKIVAAVAKGSYSVSVNSALTSDERNSLNKSGMIAPESSGILREEAMSILAKLYELKAKTQIKDYADLNTTMHFDIHDADESYRENLLKAAELGFFENKPNAVRPKDPITFGELMKIVDIIMQYSGM